MALKPLNSVGGFSVGEIPANVILANADITANNATFSGNVSISNATASWGVLTDNLYYSNGQPWDFQQAAGANGELQFNMGDDFAASPNLTFNNTTQLFTVTGNANITGTLTAGALEVDEIFNGNSNVAIPVANGNVNVSVAGNANVLVVTGTGVNVAGYLTATSTVTGSNLALTDGNIVSTGTSGLYLTPANSTAGIVVQANTAPNANNSFNLGSSSKVFANIYGNNVIVSANLDSGNANLGNLAVANYLNVNNDLNVVAGIFTGNIQVNVSANFSNVQVANFVVSNLTPSTDDQYYLGTTLKRWKDINIAGNANIGTLNTSGNGTFGNLEFGNLLTGNYATFDNDIQVIGNIANANNISATNTVFANNANITANLTSGNANLGNLAQANFVNVSQNLNVTGNIAGTYANLVGNLHIAPSGANNFGILTDYLYYANGTPWDLQEAAGSNNEIQFNTNDNFDASANFTFDPSTNVLKVTGNANVTDTVITPNVNSLAGNLTLTANGFSTVYDNTGNVTFPGNITADTFYGNVNANITITAANTTVLFSDDGLVDGTTAFTFDKNSNLVSMTGNVNLGPTGENQLVNLSNTALEIRGGWDSATSSGVNIVAGDYNNSNYWGKLAILGNVSGNAVGYSEANAFIFTDPGAGLGNVVKVDILNPNATSTTTGVIQANGGIGVTGNGYFGGDLVVTGNIANANNISVTNALAANTGNFSGNITSLNANLGNLVTANYVNVASNVTSNNVTVNLELSGNTANFSGNVVLPNLTINLELQANTANFDGNVTIDGNLNVANINASALINGNSNVRVFANGNVTISSNGAANVVTVTDTSLLVAGNIESTVGNMLANGNVTANGFLVGANAVVTSEANVGSLLTSNITSTGSLTLTAGVDGTIDLVPNGNGTVDVSNFRITQVADPINPKDATNKEYVDALVGEGLIIHTPVRVESPTALNATYAQGGTTQTTTDISGGKTITFSANHGLSVNDGIVWTNSFNGIVGGEAYWVQTVPALNQITIRDGYYGLEVTTLTNGTGLSQASRANPGVGATLTNAGANAALVVDGITLANSDRVLVYTQSNAYENGIYAVTDNGNSTAAWILTRATDFDTYIPNSSLGVGKGSYVFTQEGNTGAGEAYVMTAPTGEVIIGTDGITFTQFSAASTYKAGNGIDITGTIISANVDNITTAIVSGNIVVKAGANLTTPNLGDATFSSLSWNTLSNGNVSANNLSIGNIANITLDLTVGGNIQANGTISSNANVSGLNLTTAGNVAASANIVGANVTANSTVFAANANVSGTTTTNVLTVNTSIGGNTANFSGNVVVNNLTVNLELAGNTANFSSNVIVNNLTTNLELAGNTANFSGNVVVPNLSVNLQLAGNTANFTGNVVAANFVTSGVANVAQLNVTGNVISDLLPNANLTHDLGNATLRWENVYAGNIDASGNLTISGNLSSNNYAANIITANNYINIGNTAIRQGEVTTTSTSANQTISTVTVSGITGVEWIVKGIDSAGSGKYSMAIVSAVTDGTSVDYSTFGGVTLGSVTGSLAVNIVGSNVELQVTPSSSNSTLWVTQYRTI